jgi:uncharacterized repeat protein (TIGR01451 family)
MSNYHLKASKQRISVQARCQQYIDAIARTLVLLGLVVGGGPIWLLPAFAAPTPAITNNNPTTIDNQATGTFADLDDTSSGTQNVVSNTVSVTVAEVAGITITAGSVPTATNGAVSNFDFTITNSGNDPTKFFLPQNATVTGGTQGTLQVIAYIDAAGVKTTLTTPINITASGDTGSFGGGTLGGNTTGGSIPAGAAIVVRVPVTVNITSGNVTATLGQTTPANTNNTPYIAGTNDVYTVDHSDPSSIGGEATGVPINGDTTGHRQEASASLTAVATGSALSCSNIYAITSDATNTLLKEFDPTNGTTTTVATMGAAANAFTLGIDPISGRAYYVANAAGSAQFHVFAYNPISGATTDTGTVIPISSTSAALWLGFDQTGVGYVVDVSFNAWSFTPGSAVVTSLGTIAGMSGYNGGDIAFDSNNVGWTVSRNTTNGNYALFRITKSGNTLTAVNLGDLKEGGVTVSNASNIGSIAFDPAGNLYIVRSSDGRSWKIDPKTLVATTIASSISPNGNGLADFATCAIPIIVINPITVSGKVFSDADANVAINGSDAGTNAGSSTLTIYAVDTAGKVIDKATVDPLTGNYSLTNLPRNSSFKLRLSNDDTVTINGTAPTTPSLPTNWFHTGENLNGTIDPVIATLGDIALTTTTTNLSNENFGIRQGTVLATPPAPATCTANFTSTLTTGISSTGTQLAVGADDLNWTAEWIAGSAGTNTYAPPRPVGPMPAVVVGNLAPGFWVNEPANARWISYPFRLSTNGNGDHRNADLDANIGEDGSANPIIGTSDAVRVKFTAKITLPANANTIGISLPVGVAIDNQFGSIKVNGVENLSPVPAANPQAVNFGSFKTVNLTNGWQPGVNTIEVVMDSGQPHAGFIFGVQATSTQVCGSKANVLMVKRVTAINGDSTKNPNDNTPLNLFIDDTSPITATNTTPPNDNNCNWPGATGATGACVNTYTMGALAPGKVKPGDEIEYTIYYLNAGTNKAKQVRICDQLDNNLTFKGDTPTTPTTIAPLDIRNILGDGSIQPLTNLTDTDQGQLTTPALAGTSCNLTKNTGTNLSNNVVVVDVANPTNPLMGSTGSGLPTTSYGYVRIKTTVK